MHSLTSGVVVGRDERGEMMPSIEVAQRMAELFWRPRPTTWSASRGPQPPQPIRHGRALGHLDTLPADDRDRILYVVDSLIREAKTPHAFGAR